jgi:hypothetical protein
MTFQVSTTDRHHPGDGTPVSASMAKEPNFKVRKHGSEKWRWTREARGICGMMDATVKPAAAAASC